jgi:hypothetical protein
MEPTPSSVPYNISCEFSDQTSNATSDYAESSNSSSMDNQVTTSPHSYSSSYVPRYNRIFCIRRIQRQLRREITYSLNHIRRIPLQTTNDPFINQFFNGSPF